MEGEGIATLLVLLTFLPKMVLTAQEATTSLSDSESAACCARVQLGQMRTECVVTYEIF